MKFLTSLIFPAVLLIIFSSAANAQQGTTNLTFFGSSVCWGTGAEDDHGYAWQFSHNGALDTTRYHYFNASTGGDNTLKVEKENRLSTKLFPTHPSIVVLGLSLGNEGIGNPVDDHGREEILEQFRSRLLALADSLKRLQMIPVIVNCYANNNFKETHYQFTKRINRIINTWDYPSINVLGAIDDLTGKWVNGYFHDALHPNSRGHREMSYTIVPSLFDALLAGKKTPHYDWHRSYNTLLNPSHATRPLMITVQSTMHSFSLSFRFKNAADGGIAGWSAARKTESIRFKGNNLHYENLVVPISADRDTWTHVVLSHSYANQKTQLFVDGNLVGSVNEQLSPEQVFFGGTSAHVDLKDLSLHRAALNSSEALDLFNKKFIQSSLEYYNPLTQAGGEKLLGNEAQSLTLLEIDPQTHLQFQYRSF